MKYSVLVCLVLAAVGLTTASAIAIDEVHAEIDAYQQQRAATLRSPRSGGSNNLLCYDKYIPQVTSVAEQGKAETQTCITTALDNRNQSETQLENQRLALDENIRNVENSLDGCSIQPSLFDYLSCLKNNVVSNQVQISTIASSSTAVFEQLNAEFVAIDTEENSCVSSVIATAKKDTDDVFEKLQFCLIHGLPNEPNEPNEPTTAQPPEDSSNAP